MHVIITARHCDIPDQLRSLIEERFAALTRFEPRASRAEVAVTGRKNGFEAEAVVSVDRSERVHGRAEESEMRMAIDRLVQKVSVQLRRRHGRRRDHRAPPMDELFGDPSTVSEADEP
ncbi:MAG: ribosome-associated translation inhibitor RaiA [Gemmatimonadota bacterium]|nr:ribosome-associated translation inhibitor RaiA [Gemmatimonadota bacterium]